MALIFGLKIQFTHLRGKQCQFTDRTRDSLCHKPDHKSTDHNDQNANIEIKFIRYGNALTYALQWRSDQKIAAIFEFSPTLHIFHSGKAVPHLLYNIILILLECFCMIILFLIQIISITDQPGLQKIFIASDRTYCLSICCDHYPGKIIL